MDEFNRKWIIEKGIPIVNEYGGNLTLRALHYRLVAIGMTNTVQHYKRVIAAMTVARWEGLVNFSSFVDHDRSVEGKTDYERTDVESSVEQGKESIEFWMRYYSKNRWENQEYYPEVFIEKKALQSVFDTPCNNMDVALCPCKGYPSLTYLDQASDRFREAECQGKKPIILYFGDYDPSGEDIPRSLKETIIKMGVNIELKRFALMEHQVIEMNLPPAPAKKTDSRTANWDGLGQVELDAIEPRQLQKMCTEAINQYFDRDLYVDLLDQQMEESIEYKKKLKEFVLNIE